MDRVLRSPKAWRHLSGAAALIAATLLGPSASEAQGPSPAWMLEIRAVATHPPPCLIKCGDYGDAGIEWGLDGGADVPIGRGGASLYGTLSLYRLRFSTRGAHDGMGASAGLRFGIAQDSRGPWIGAGLLLHRREFGFADPTTGRTETWSDLGPGLELIAGWDIAVSHGFAVSPGFQYRRYKTDVDTDDDPRTSESRRGTSYFAVSLGVRHTIW